jgi:ABC-2 type transport system permease protein
MTTAGAADLRNVMRMEWCKLRTIRSTWWTLAVFAAGMVGLAAMAAASGPVNPGPGYDATENLFGGLALGQLAIGILGVLTVSSEFTSGSIRATFGAVPRRGLVMAAKAAVTVAVTLAAGEALAFAAFAAFQIAARHGVPHPSLGRAVVLRGVLLAGAYPCLIGLIGLGLAAIIRHTAGAISAIVGVTFVLPLALLPLGNHNAVVKFLPYLIASNSLTPAKPLGDGLSAGAGFAVLCLYAAVALAAGSWALIRRDA